MEKLKDRIMEKGKVCKGNNREKCKKRILKEKEKEKEMKV